MRENKTNPNPDLSAKRAAAGRKGGLNAARVVTARRAAASRANGANGGRPPLKPSQEHAGAGKAAP